MTEHLYYDFRQMQTAFTGTVPIIGEANPYSDMVCAPPCALTPNRLKNCKLPGTRTCLWYGSVQLNYLTCPHAMQGVEDGSERAPSDRADLSRGSMDLRRRASLNAGNESADPGKGPRPKLGRPSRLLSALSPHTTPTTAGAS